MDFSHIVGGIQKQPSILHLLLSKLEAKAFGQAGSTSCNLRIRCHIPLNNLGGHHFVLLCISWCYLLKRDILMHCLSTIGYCVHLHHNKTFFFYFSASQPSSAPDSGQAAAEPFCSHTHFLVILTCQCAQNCQTLLKAVDAMCNSFNTRPCRYPYHCCNGMPMPPCILQACKRQLVIHLIYSTRPAVDRAHVVLTARTWPDTQQPSSFRGDLRVVCDSIAGQKTIIYDTLSTARDAAFIANECGNTWRNEKSWSELWWFVKRYRSDVLQLINIKSIFFDF